jgi:hypothetical protein
METVLKLDLSHRLRMCENRIISKIFASKKDKVEEAEENCFMKSFMIYTVHHILLK